jgi:[acyl-carrier-protein] S-malonyltransferase
MRNRSSAPHLPDVFHYPSPYELQESKDLPAVRKMLDTAQSVLGYDLLALCLEGPKEKLDDTVYAQVKREEKGAVCLAECGMVAADC